MMSSASGRTRPGASPTRRKALSTSAPECAVCGGDGDRHLCNLYSLTKGQQGDPRTGRRLRSSASLSCRSTASRTGVPSSSVTRSPPGTLGRRLRVDLEDDCSGRPNPLWTLVPRLRPSHPQPRPAASSWPRARLPCAPLPAVWRAVPRSPPASPSRYCPPCSRPPAVDRLGLTNNPRIKHCRASHLAACGHTASRPDRADTSAGSGRSVHRKDHRPRKTQVRPSDPRSATQDCRCIWRCTKAYYFSAAGVYPRLIAAGIRCQSEEHQARKWLPTR